MKSKIWGIFLIVPMCMYAVSIEDINKEVLKNSPQIKETVKYYDSIKKDVDIAKAGYKPTLDVVAGYGRETTKNSSTNYKNKSLNKSEIGVVLNQNLFEGFGTKYNIKRQIARLDSAAFGVLEQANKTVLKMSEVYLALYKQNKLLKLAQENVLSHIEIDNKIKERMSAGVGTESEFKESASRLALARSNVAVVENNYNDAVSNFVRMYGYYIDPNKLDEPKELENLPKTKKEAIELSKSLNPSLKVQKANIDVEKNNYNYAKKEFYPKIDLEARKDWNYNVGGVDGKDESSSIMLKFNYNLYNGGADEASSKKSYENMQKESAVYSDLVRRVDESINLAWASKEALKRQIKYLKIHKELSEKTLNLFMEEFDLDRRTLLDILDTKEEVYSAKRELIIARYNYIFAQYRLLEAIGTLASRYDDKFFDIINLDTSIYEQNYNSSKDDDVKNIPMIMGTDENLDELSKELSKNLVKDTKKEITPNENTQEIDQQEEKPVYVRFKVWGYDINDISKENIVSFIKEAKNNPDAKIEISGYTDSWGRSEVNLKRSKQRANIVAKELIKNGIDKSRLIVNGYGEENFIADNSTKEGREQNRRVELKLIK
jgi:adhesin transport system outer membrane protein